MANDSFKKEQKRTFLVLLIGFTILIYVLLSENMFLEAKVYGGMGIFSILVLVAFKYFWRKSKKKNKESLEEVYVGVSKRPFKGLIIGIIFAVSFIVLSQVKFFSSISQLITPSIALSSAGATFLVVFAIASIFEETSFTTSLTSFLSLYLPFPLVAIIKGVAFASAHYYAYVIVAGTTLQYALGAFIGAGVFGVLSAYIGKYYGSESAIAGHGIFNGYNFAKLYQWLVITG